MWAGVGLLAAVGCTRRTVLDGDPGERGSPPSQDDVVPPDTGGPSTAPLCLPDDVEGFSIPSARWGLASFLGSQLLAEPDDSALQLSPEWFLSSGWQADYFGCGGYGAPWSDAPSNTSGGCFALEQQTHWVEVMRLFPDRFSELDWPDSVDGDQPERSAVTLVHALYAGHLLLWRLDDVNPDQRLPATADPRTVARVATWLHAEGPWSRTAEVTLTSCPDDLLSCVPETAATYAAAAEAKLLALENAPCASMALSDADVEGFLTGLEPLWPSADWPAIERSVDAVRRTGTLEGDGPAVVDVVLSALDSTLFCPEQNLWDLYRYSCP
ncbi:MAG: hypothetical protein VX265_19120 [Myxococcota bacterium]|nr:hypothetical protein [Myxococcota bacterium]